MELNSKDLAELILEGAETRFADDGNDGNDAWFNFLEGTGRVIGSMQEYLLSRGASLDEVHVASTHFAAQVALVALDISDNTAAKHLEKIKHLVDRWSDLERVRRFIDGQGCG